MTQEQSEDNPKLVVANCIDIFIRNGIVNVVYDDGAEVGMEMIREAHSAYLQITGNTKMPFLFRSRGSFYISKDARDLARKLETRQPFSAVACFAPTLDLRLMAEFYGKFYKPEIPYKVFSSEAEAIEWLGQSLEK